MQCLGVLLMWFGIWELANSDAAQPERYARTKRKRVISEGAPSRFGGPQ